MPVEIRELIIKTEITSPDRLSSQAMKDRQLERLKKQLLHECKKIVSPAAKRNMHKR